MSSNLGSMILELSANTAQFQSDMGKAAYIAQQNAEKMQKTIQGAVDGIGSSLKNMAGGLLAAFSIDRLVEFGNQAIETADKLGKMAQKVGVSVESLSALSVQAKLSGGGIEDLQIGMEKLAKNAAAAAGGSKEQAAAFTAIGVSVKDASGQLRPMQEILGDVAQKFSGYSDSAAKTALAQQLFGKSGAELIPILNDLGEKGLAGVTKEAEEFGAVISGETSKRAEEFQDNLTKLGVETKGFATAVTSQLLPALDRLTSDMVDAGKTTEGYAGSASVVSNAIKSLVLGLIAAKEIIAGVETAVFGLFDAISTVFNASGELVGAFADSVQKGLRAAFHLDKAAADAADAEFESRAKAIGAKVVTAFAGVGEAVKHGVGDSIDNTKKAFNDLFGTFSNVSSGARSTADHLRNLNAPLVGNVAAAEAAAKAAQRLSEMFAKDDEILAELGGKLGPLQKVYGDYAKGILAATAAYQKELALAAEAGNKDKDLAHAKDILVEKTTALLKARQEETAELIKQNDEVQKYLDKVAQEQALVGLSDHQREVTKAISEQVTWWNNLTEAQRKDFEALGILNPMLKETQDRIGGVTGALYDSQKAAELANSAQSPYEKMQEDLALVAKELERIKTLAPGAFDPKYAERLVKELGALKQQQLEYATHTIGQGITALQSMAGEGTKAYKELQIAQDALNLTTAIGAIVNQGLGDPYTAFARIAAMAAIMASLVHDIGSLSGGGPSAQSAQIRQQTQGTGTVLGDAKAQSDSIAKATAITADATQQLVGLNRGMLNALQALQNALGAAGVQLARGAGNVTFPSLGGGAGVNLLLGLDPTLNSFLFGGSKKVIDQGIVIFGGALQDMLNNVAVGAYQTIHKSGGLFGSSKTYDQTQSVSDDFSKQFQLVIGSLVDAVKQGATALGVSQEQIDAAIAAYHVAEQHISLKGLSAEDQQKALEAVFSSIFDGLAAAVVPFVGQFQKVGEGLGETLVRVATEVQVTQQAMRSLGLAISETDPEKFAQIADALTNAVGGIDAFISGMNSFVDKFASSDQKFALEKDALTSAFDQVGLSIPATREGMYDLMKSLDASTDAGRAQIATLLRLSDVADQYYSALEKAGGSQADLTAKLQSLVQSTQQIAAQLFGTGIDQLQARLQKILDFGKETGFYDLKGILAIKKQIAEEQEQQAAAQKLQQANSLLGNLGSLGVQTGESLQQLADQFNIPLDKLADIFHTDQAGLEKQFEQAKTTAAASMQTAINTAYANELLANILAAQQGLPLPYSQDALNSTANPVTASQSAGGGKFGGGGFAPPNRSSVTFLKPSAFTSSASTQTATTQPNADVAKAIERHGAQTSAVIAHLDAKIDALGTNVVNLSQKVDRYGAAGVIGWQPGGNNLRRRPVAQ